jgi:azurin
MKNLRMLTVAVVLGIALVLTACGGNGGAAGGGAAGGTAGGGAATIDIGSAGENLAFDKTTLTATAGQQMTVNFKNNSASQQHNWVLVSGGDDVASAVANAGLTAGPEANYLPADKAQVVASTPLANGGETTTASFTAPAAGTYQFICTVPGHYPLMKGTLTVQ